MNTTLNSATPAGAERSLTISPKILITGATGSIGTELTRLLSEQGVPFRAMVRSPKDAQALSTLPHAEIVAGDFNEPATLMQALTGIERAFLLTNSSEQAEAQQMAFVAAAQKAGLRHLVKLSQLAARVDSPVRFLRYHAAVEQAIEATGIPFTFLRPNLFMQGLLSFRESIRYQGQFFAAIGDARISAIDIRDIAAVAATVLLNPGHEGQTYTLTGPEALTHDEMADQLSTALARPIAFVDISPKAMRHALTEAGFPTWQAEGLIEDYAHYSRHEASAVSTAVQNVTGRPPYSFMQFARAYAPAFL